MILLLVYGWVFFFKAPQVGAGHSDLPLIEAYQRACAGLDCRLIYPAKPAYSAYFYTGGRLYAGMPGSPGAPAFKVVARVDKSSLPAAALACNRQQCLLRDEVVANPGQ
jgi:hypothetical protein